MTIRRRKRGADRYSCARAGCPVGIGAVTGLPSYRETRIQLSAGGSLFALTYITVKQQQTPSSHHELQRHASLCLTVCQQWHAAAGITPVRYFPLPESCAYTWNAVLRTAVIVEVMSFEDEPCADLRWHPPISQRG